MKLIFGILLPSAASISSTTFLVTLALNLSPFSCGGRRNVLPIKLSGSNSGMGLIMDGPASSCLDLMKTVGTLRVLVYLEPSEDPIDVPDSPPSISSLWLGFDLTMGITALLYMIF